MINELESLLSNAHTPHSQKCFSAIIVMKDGITFSGVIIKNQIFRDAIYAEQIAIARAIAAGYKYGDFNKLHIMVNTNNINDFKYINRDVIIEFMEPDALITLYDINRNSKTIKAGYLSFNIY